MVKYMLKDMDDHRLMGLKSYMTSRGLIRPDEYKGESAKLIIKHLIKQKKEVYANTYTSEHFGNITYKEYNLNRK